jgi:glucoamylase
MPRDLPIGNGNLLVAFDRDYLLREFYFPHVGEENHTNGKPFRFGLWVAQQFVWIPDGWRIRKEYLDDALVTDVELVHESLHLRMHINDLVDFHENLYLRRVTIENLSDQEREVRLFFAHDFSIYGNEIGDTAEFRPENSSLLHYKGERYFLINIYAKGKFGIDHFATGNKIPGVFEGTWKDAEDGVLSGNPIAQGSVDSTLAIPLKLAGKAQETCFYWICCGKTWEEVRALNELVKKRGPESFLTRTQNYWKLWVNKEPINNHLLPAKVLRLYKKSLLITRSQINNCGSIIAGNDSDVMHFNRDTYSYMWPRDGAFVAYALDLAGYGSTVDFYNFCGKVIEKGGYLLHKYTPSGSLASSWHPWLKETKPQLPIQEDETALVLWALWKHYELFKDIEFIKPLYKTLIKRGADFMMNYRDTKTGLPLPSYDLWEERQGVLTFTVSSVYGGLIASAYFAEAFGEKELAQEYREGAARMREGMDRYLYLEKEHRFARMVNFKQDGSIEIDATIDASLYGSFAFGAYSPNNEKVKNTMEQVYAKLWHPNGGLARYENDPFYRVSHTGTGNPWFVTTLWLAQYYIARAQEEKELAKALEILEWIADRALPSGVLAEQIDPTTHEPLSVSPLTWSHATYIATVQEYLNKLLKIEKCPTCGHPKLSKTLGANPTL